MILEFMDMEIDPIFRALSEFDPSIPNFHKRVVYERCFDAFHFCGVQSLNNLAKSAYSVVTETFLFSDTSA